MSYPYYFFLLSAIAFLILSNGFQIFGDTAWVLEDKARWRKLCDHARQKAEREFTLELQAQRYITLYNQLYCV
jgi:hypothetical protein